MILDENFLDLVVSSTRNIMAWSNLGNLSNFARPIISPCFVLHLIDIMLIYITGTWIIPLCLLLAATIYGWKSKVLVVKSSISSLTLPTSSFSSVHIVGSLTPKGSSTIPSCRSFTWMWNIRENENPPISSGVEQPT